MNLHSWNLSVAEAKELQTKLRTQTVTTNSLGSVEWVAGTDVGFIDNYRLTRAVVVVLSFPGLELVESAIAIRPTTFPYIPGLLSFREIPALKDAYHQLSTCPDLVLCDGQGIAHPRRMGIATHLGLWLDVPTIGVAKSRLIGTHRELEPHKGSWQPLYDGREIVGAVVRSRTNVKPLYVSVGHRIDLATAIDYTLRCTTRYRLPETTRQADKLASDR